MQNLNVLILAGGRGTRLRSVWGGPKCLAPVFTTKEPLLVWLLKNVVAPLKPSQVVLSLGHKSVEVLGHLSYQRTPLHCVNHIDPIPMGTTYAVTGAAQKFLFGPGPTLILNGDTLPGYGMQAFVETSRGYRSGPHVSMAWQKGLDVEVPVPAEYYAGASLVTREVMDMFREGHFLFDPRPDVEQILSVVAQRVYVSKFLDIGTPERLAMAQSMAEEDWMKHEEWRWIEDLGVPIAAFGVGDQT